MSRKVFVIIAGIGAICMIALTMLNNEQGYQQRILKAREQQLYNFQTSKNSPFATIEKPSNLSFFEINEQFKTIAKVVPITSYQPFVLKKNDENEQQTFVKYAYLDFSLAGKKCRLTLFQNEKDESDYLLPFTDQTSGKNSYGSGRFLPVQNFNINKDYVIDFNLATNPYCAYNENYVCPLPPEENHVDVAIEAGEKNYH